MSVADRAMDLERIYAEHLDFLWRTLHHLGVRDADLEDVLQDVFVVIHRRSASYDRKSALTSWLFGICLRVASNERRRARHRREELMGVVGDHLDGADHRDPETSAMRGEARAELDAIMDTMTPVQQAVFRMYEIETIACEDIARTFGVPVGTIHSRLFGARKQFRLELERRKQALDGKGERT